MSFLLPIRYCSQCGGATELKLIAGEDRPRAVCSQCAMVHYQNPRIVTCALITDDHGRLLMAKRNIEPRKGYWTLPGGFMELNETLEQSALRETEEETHCRVRIDQLFCVVSVANVGQVHMFFNGQLIAFDDTPTAESTEVRLYARGELPWDALAFMTVRTALNAYIQAPHSLQVASL